MKSQLKDERGAVLIIELVVLAVVLVAAGFAAYHYLQHRKSANHASKPVPHIASKDTPSPGSAGAVLDIKELGVEIPLNNGPSNLRYQIENVPGLGTVSALDTNQLDQASSCSPGRLGLIVKAEGTIPSGLKPSYTTDESGAQLNYLLKQFNGFYVRHVAPAKCVLAARRCNLP